MFSLSYFSLLGKEMHFYTIQDFNCGVDAQIIGYILIKKINLVAGQMYHSQ